MINKKIDLEKKADSLLGKTLYIPTNIKIFEAKIIDVCINAGHIFAKIEEKLLQLNNCQFFVLNSGIFETKEEALDKMIEMQQNKMKDLAIQFKKEKQFLEEMLEDVEVAFIKLKKR